jgi:hypothetical protein
MMPPEPLPADEVSPFDVLETFAEVYGFVFTLLPAPALSARWTSRCIAS